MKNIKLDIGSLILYETIGGNGKLYKIIAEVIKSAPDDLLVNDIFAINDTNDDVLYGEYVMMNNDKIIKVFNYGIDALKTTNPEYFV